MRKIFVFGSNEAGIHGAGSAYCAFKQHGAIWGEGVGLYGESYAIPTKDKNLRTLPLDKVADYVKDFIKFTNKNPEMQFKIVAIGCGLAGYKPEEIGPFFKGAPANCILPKEFL